MTGTIDLSAAREELLNRRLLGRMTTRDDRIGPARRDTALPLSFAQRRLWILDQLRPGGTEYLMTTALRLCGVLDGAALRYALNTIETRHEVLRTRYMVLDGEPVQVVDDPAGVRLSEVDLRKLDDDARARRLDALLTVERRPVDLAAGPVFGATLVRLGEREHALILTVHHIASDGWSDGVLVRELTAAYAASVRGRPARLPVLSVQYPDYAAWQRKRLSGESLDRELDHWRDRLTGATPVELPTDRPRPAVWDAAGDEVPFVVPASVARTLTTLARRCDATPYLVLLTAFTVLLGRYGGRSEVTVGMPVAGRDRAELQDLVGLFLNTLVLRADLSGSPGFVELLGRVRDGVLDAHGHQDVPFEYLVAELHPERDLARNPLFSTMLLWQDEDQLPTDVEGLVVDSIPVPETNAKFDLTMVVSARADGSLAGSVNFPTALFDRDTMARLAGHFVRLLTSIADSPECPVDDLRMVPRAELDRVLVEWNDTHVTYPTGTLTALCEAQATRTPDEAALRFDGRTMTYAELDGRANRLAHRLRRLGIGPESVAAVCLPRGPELVVALLAVMKAGGAYLPLDPDHPREWIRHLLVDSGATVVVTDRQESGHTIPMVDVHADFSDEPESRLDIPVRPEHPAYVIYTSGSTGRPKGVVVEHRAIVNRLSWMQQAFGLDTSDRVVQKTPCGFDVSVWELFWPLITGATMVLARPGGHRDPGYLAGLIRAERVTTVHFVPSMLRAFLAEPFDGLPSLRRLICSGEALPPDLVTAVQERIGCELHNLYGPTEAAVDVTATRCVAGEPVTIGKPIANTQTYILDTDLRPVPVGVPGELVLGGVQLARGYLHRPALTAERFVPNPFQAGTRLYRTGDLARHRPNGDIEYLGRLDHQVKINGQRVELGEIDTVLTEHPDVTAATTTVHDGQLVAYLVPRTVQVDAVRRFVARRLPEQFVPAHWMLLDRLPVTVNGKTDRKALPAPDGQRPAHTGEYVAPSTALERRVAHEMADAIGVDRVGRGDSFFQLGGDSMRAIRVVGALRADGFPVAVHELFSHRTPERLAALLSGRSTAPVADTTVEPFELVSDVDRSLLPVGLVDAYPMARTQAGMVYEMLVADRPVYQNVSCYRVHDEFPFSLPVLEEAARLVVERHEIMRTSFDLSTYSETMQLVHRDADLPIGYTDLRDTPEADRRAIVDEFMVEERARPFDLSRPPLVRHHVHQVEDGEWWLTHTECHAILDGWSHTSLVTDVIATYRTLRGRGRPHATPVPDVRFADFVALERRSLDSEEDRTFWSSVMAGHDKLELPESWGGDADTDARATIIDVPLTDLEPGLRGLAAAADASMKSVLHAAHLKALSMVTGRSRFFDGLVCNGRPELLRGDEVLGMYLNTVPFAADVTASTWRGLVESVFAEEVRLWPHRRYPMPAMRRDRGDSAPLVEIAFGYLDFHVLDWESESVGLLDDFSPSELTLEVWTFPGVLRLGARPSRIDRPRLELLARTYRHVLEAMAADPEDDPRALSLAPADHRRAITEARGATRTVPAGQLVHELITGQASSTPEAIALRYGDETVDYATLDQRANRLAHRLRAVGVGPDVVVGLYLPRSPELVTALLAVLKAGGAFLPLDPDYPSGRVEHMLTDATATVVLTTAALRAALPATASTIVDLDGFGDDGPPSPPEVRPDPDNLAYVIYTSGSTGRPKGVALSHRGTVNLRHAQRDHLDIHPGDAVLQFASPSFDASVWEVVLALTNGAELVLPPPHTDPGDLRRQAGLVTHMTLPPSLLDRLSPADFPRLRVLVSAGEACPGDQARRWAEHTRFINAYGPTESSVCATLTPVLPTSQALSPSIGHPLANLEAYVLDQDLRLLPAGVPGELCLGGAGLARGYLNRPDLTADRFVPDPSGTHSGARLYRTGDLVSRNEDGTLQYHGRIDHQVKVRGFRVELGEIEEALVAHPSVASAVVLVDGTGGDASLVAYTRSGDADAPTAVELRTHLAERLPRHLVPTHYVTVEDFALTPAGKVDRTALPALDRDRLASARTRVAPRTGIEHAIAEAWSEALGLRRVGVHDDFFEVGGHSLAIMRIIATLRARHGYELTFRSFTQHPTIAGLAGTVGAERPVGAMMWLRREGTRTPLVCVHPGGGSAHWYQRLVPHVDPDRPVIAFEWPGPHDGVATPTAEAMAERYLAELRQALPAGPYRIFSWCGGGGIATEMAHRLTDAGHEVTLVLLDPGLDAHTRADGWRELELIRRLSRLLDEVVGGGQDADTPRRRGEILALLEHLVDDVDEETGITLPEQGVGDEWPTAARVWREVMEMDLNYRHRTYPGRLHLFVSDELAGGAHEVASGQTFEEYLGRWRELVAGDVHVHRVPGDHFGVMKPPIVSLLASEIDQVITNDETAGSSA